MNASSAASCSSRPFPLDFQGPQPTSVYSPVTWSDLWNMPDENAVLALSFALGDAPQSPARPDSALDRLAYDICQLGHCTMAQMARLCSELPGQQVAKRRKRCTSDGETGRRQHTFSVGAFAAGGTVGVQNNTRRYPWTTPRRVSCCAVLVSCYSRVRVTRWCSAFSEHLLCTALDGLLLSAFSLATCGLCPCYIYGHSQCRHATTWPCGAVATFVLVCACTCVRAVTRQPGRESS